MKYLLSFIVALALASLSALGATATAADRAWEELQQLGLLELKVPGNYTGFSVRQRREWSERRAKLLREKGLVFYEANPADPRRWRVVWRMVNDAPLFVTSYGPNIETIYTDFAVDQPAAAEWNARLAQLEAAMSVAPDLPADVREELDLRAVNRVISPVFAAASKGQPADLTEAEQTLLAFAAKYPESPKPVAILAKQYMPMFEQSHSVAESTAMWRVFVGSQNRELAEMARAKVQAFDTISAPLELVFTALDGREVDLKKLRGKVVFLDFWATWCGGCMAEMPNVKKVYDAYHDQGFEVVGISCDYAPDQVGRYQAGAAKTGPQLLEFCAKNDMPWPEYYDGRKHNEGGNLLAQRFAITGIPASLLVDQTGNVVARNLKGEKLEAEVKRLLKL